jgi:hypothetical protein
MKRELASLAGYALALWVTGWCIVSCSSVPVSSPSGWVPGIIPVQSDYTPKIVTTVTTNVLPVPPGVPAQVELRTNVVLVQGSGATATASGMTVAAKSVQTNWPIVAYIPPNGSNGTNEEWCLTQSTHDFKTWATDTSNLQTVGYFQTNNFTSSNPMTFFRTVAVGDRIKALAE